MLRTLVAFLGLSDLFLTLFCGTLSLLILTLSVATLFLRVLFALSLLFPALLTLLVVLRWLLAPSLGLLRTLSRLFASAFCLLRWVGRLPFFAAARSRPLLLLGLVLLAPLLTSNTSPLSTGKVGRAQ